MQLLITKTTNVTEGGDLRRASCRPWTFLWTKHMAWNVQIVPYKL